GAGRIPQGAEGLSVRARLLEMGGQLGGDVTRSVAITLFFALGDRPMELAPARGRDALVKSASVERVYEPVSRGHRSVGPLPGTERSDEELTTRQLVAALLHLGLGPLEGRGDRGRRELHAGDASRGQDSAFILRELAHAALDHLAEALGNADFGLFEYRAGLPSSLALRDAHCTGQSAVDD